LTTSLLHRLDDYLTIRYVRANGSPNVAIRALDALYGLALRVQGLRLTYAQRVLRDAPVLCVRGDERRVDVDVTLEEGVQRAKRRVYAGRTGR
jgi:hypothetical protein